MGNDSPVKLIRPKVFGDERGWFSETWSDERFRRSVADCSFVQDNHSLSASTGTVRGIHYLKWGTDKASNNHDYLVSYDRHIGDMRLEATRVLEIGVFNGASLKMWRDYFPNAEVLGLDIKEASRIHEGERIRIEIGDGSDESFLNSIGQANGQFDLIVDDGSHQWAHQQKAFDVLFKFLRPGGIFIIEDIHTSYHAKYGKKAKITTMEWLKQRLDIVVTDRIAHAAIPNIDNLNEWRQEVEEVAFIKKSVLIRKRRVSAAAD